VIIKSADCTVPLFSFNEFTFINLCAFFFKFFINGPLGPVYTTVEKASGRSRMLGQDMVI
jgi:hypothetical protein